jgi:hypothetical protein
MTDEELLKTFVAMLERGVRDETAVGQCLHAASDPVTLGKKLMKARERWYADQGKKPPRYRPDGAI